MGYGVHSVVAVAMAPPPPQSHSWYLPPWLAEGRLTCLLVGISHLLLTSWFCDPCPHVAMFLPANLDVGVRTQTLSSTEETTGLRVIAIQNQPTSRNTEANGKCFSLQFLESSLCFKLKSRIYLLLKASVFLRCDYCVAKA